MLVTKKFYKKRALLSSFVFCLSVFLLSIAVPAQADDNIVPGTVSITTLDWYEQNHDNIKIHSKNRLQIEELIYNE